MKKSNPSGAGTVYTLTEPGADLARVIDAMGAWGERWLDVTPQHADPLYFLNSWIHNYLNHDNLPEERVVVRFEFTDQPPKTNPMWVIFDKHNPEVCRTYPGYNEDLIVKGEAVALAEWHLGRIEWTQVITSGRITISGIPKYATTLQTWNQRSRWTSSPHPPNDPPITAIRSGTSH